MNQTLPPDRSASPLDYSGFRALCGIAAFYRIAADPAHLQRELALHEREPAEKDIVRAAATIGLKARIVENVGEARLAGMPVPAIIRLKGAGFYVFGGKTPTGLWRIVDPVTRIDRELPPAELIAAIEPRVILIARRFGGAGLDPRTFGFRWFLP